MKVPRTLAPRSPTGIWGGHHLCDQLMFAAYPLGQSWYDAVSGTQAKNMDAQVFNNQPVQAAGAWSNPGQCLRGTANGNFQWQSQIPGDFISGTRFSIFAECSGGVNSFSNATLVTSTDSGNGDTWGLRLDDVTNANSFSLQGNNSAVITATAGALGANSESFMHRIAVTLDGTTARTYANGLAINTAASSVNITARTTRRMQIFGRVLSTGAGSGITVVGSIILAYKRTLTPGEITELTTNPWQVFTPLERRVFMASGGAPTFLPEWLYPVGGLGSGLGV